MRRVVPAESAAPRKTGEASAPELPAGKARAWRGEPHRVRNEPRRIGLRCWAQFVGNWGRSISPAIACRLMALTGGHNWPYLQHVACLGKRQTKHIERRLPSSGPFAQIFSVRLRLRSPRRKKAAAELHGTANNFSCVEESK